MKQDLPWQKSTNLVILYLVVKDLEAQAIGSLGGEEASGDGEDRTSEGFNLNLKPHDPYRADLRRSL